MKLESNLQVIRPLGSSERLYWLYDQIICRNFSIIVETKETISTELLRSAISTTISNYLLLQAKIKTGTGNQLIFVKVPVEEAVSNIIIIDDSSLSVNEQVLKEINTQFDILSFPLMRSCIVRASEETKELTSIIFTFHHSMTDAIGAVDLVKKIMAHLISTRFDTFVESPNDSPVPLYAAQESFFPSKFQGFGLLRSLTKGIVARRKIAKRARRADHLVPVGKLNIQRELDLIRLEFNVSQTEMMLKSCRENRVTLNGFLCASLLLSVIEEFEVVIENNKRNIAIPIVTAINMRRVLKESTQLKNMPGMFASILETTHVLNPSTNIWELARDISESVKANLDRGSAHVFLKLLSLVKRKLTPDKKGINFVTRLMSKGTYGPFVTNLGVIDPPQMPHENMITSMSFITAPVANFPILWAASSWAGKLSINIPYDISVIQKEKAKRIVGNMKQLLIKGMNI